MSEIQSSLGDASGVVAKELWKAQKFDNQTHKCLEMFKAHQWISTVDLSNVFKQYNARIHELRTGKLGTKYDIVTHKKGCQWGFLYRGKD